MLPLMRLRRFVECLLPLFFLLLSELAPSFFGFSAALSTLFVPLDPLLVGLALLIKLVTDALLERCLLAALLLRLLALVLFLRTLQLLSDTLLFLSVPLRLRVLLALSWRSRGLLWVGLGVRLCIVGEGAGRDAHRPSRFRQHIVVIAVMQPVWLLMAVHEIPIVPKVLLCLLISLAASLLKILTLGERVLSFAFR